VELGGQLTKTKLMVVETQEEPKTQWVWVVLKVLETEVEPQGRKVEAKPG